jgi:hypothetical protein
MFFGTHGFGPLGQRGFGARQVHFLFQRVSFSGPPPRQRFGAMMLICICGSLCPEQELWPIPTQAYFGLSGKANCFLYRGRFAQFSRLLVMTSRAKRPPFLLDG